MNKIRIGGVPEHFNLPIKLAIERGDFLEAGIDLELVYFNSGTGAMAKALDADEIDIAILLTEGFLAAANKGLAAKIIKVYIDSPLVWGIFTGKNAGLNSIYAAQNKKYAISRFGSGSHLMALIHAEQRGVLLQENDFVIVNDLDSAATSLFKNETAVFYWEKYTTKEYVEKNLVKMIGEFSAPWSSFLVVAADKILQNKPALLDSFCKVLNQIGEQVKSNLEVKTTLVNNFHLSEKDANKWLETTFWNSDFTIRKRGLSNAVEALNKVIMPQLDLSVEKFCSKNMKFI